VDALRTTLGVYYRVDVRSVVDMQAAIRQVGALYVSGTVHEGWAVPTGKRLRGHAEAIQAVAQPKDPGGHAFALVGYNERGFVVQNSWGPDWAPGLCPAALRRLGEPWQRRLGLHAGRAGSSLGPATPAVGARPRPRSRVHRAAAIAFGRRPGGHRAARRPGGRRGRAGPPLPHLRDAACRPLDPDQAYRHTVVLDRGFAVRNDITAEDAAAALEAAVLHRPLAALPAQGPAKLLIYAHGGLNSEADAIRRIRVWRPMLAQGIYPLFITWRSGPLETWGTWWRSRPPATAWGRSRMRRPGAGWTA
jgi:hypothetical protein